MPDKTSRQVTRVSTVTSVVVFITGPALGAAGAPWWVIGIALAAIFLLGWIAYVVVRKQGRGQKPAPQPSDAGITEAELS